MCMGCWADMGYSAEITPAAVLAAVAVEEVYKYSAVGGNAHIVLDDWNLEDEHIIWCLDSAVPDNIHEAGHKQIAAEVAALKALFALDEAGRCAAMAIHEGFVSPWPQVAVLGGGKEGEDA